jgi:hypothetical protein
MENYREIIKDEYVKLSRQLTDLTEKCQEYVIEIKGTNDDKILDVYCNNKKILSAVYEILGTYDTQCNLFFWSKNMKFADRQVTKISREIKKHSKKIKSMILEKKYKDIDYLEKMYYYTSNNIFFVFPDNISEIIEFSVFFCKCKGILKYKNNSAKEGKLIYTYYIITDILGT